MAIKINTNFKVAFKTDNLSSDVVDKLLARAAAASTGPTRFHEEDGKIVLETSDVQDLMRVLRDEIGMNPDQILQLGKAINAAKASGANYNAHPASDQAMRAPQEAYGSTSSASGFSTEPPRMEGLSMGKLIGLVITVAIIAGAIFMLVSGHHFLPAQNIDKKEKSKIEQFDKLLSGQFPADGPGCAALVAKKGRIIY